MSFFPGTDPEVGDKLACDAIELMVIPSAKDIGGFEVAALCPPPSAASSALSSSSTAWGRRCSGQGKRSTCVRTRT